MARPREFDIDEALDKAMQVFWEQGYEATSLQDLMNAMGLKKGSIYKAFHDKHTLFMQALQRYLDVTGGELVSIFQGEGSHRERFHQWMEMMIQFSCSPCSKGCLLINSVVELGPHDEKVQALVKEADEFLDAQVTQFILGGQEEGEFRTDMPASECALLLKVFMTGLMSGSKGMLTPDEMKKVTTSLSKIILKDENEREVK